MGRCPRLVSNGPLALRLAARILPHQLQNLRRTRDLLLPRLLSGQVELKTQAAGTPLPPFQESARFHLAVKSRVSVKLPPKLPDIEVDMQGDKNLALFPKMAYFQG